MLGERRLASLPAAPIGYATLIGAGGEVMCLFSARVGAGTGDTGRESVLVDSGGSGLTTRRILIS